MWRLKDTLKFYYLTTIFLCCVAIQVSYGQIKMDSINMSPGKVGLLRVIFQFGNIVNNGQAILNHIDENGYQIKRIQAFSAEYGWQMLGEKDWHQICNFPRAGIGVQFLDIVNRDELGHPISVYAFYDGNYLRKKNFSVTNRLSLGAALGTKKYDPADKLPSDIFSTNLNAFVELGVGMNIRLNNFIFLEPGIRLTHFSNGNMREPQKGLNIVSYSLGVVSNMRSTVSEPVRKYIAPCLHRHEILGYIGMAPRQVQFYDKENNNPYETFGLNFLMANLHLGYNYEISQRVKLGGGADLIYDGTNGQVSLLESRIPGMDVIAFKDKMKLSLFVGAESVIERLSILITLGYVVAETKFACTSPSFQQRLGFKYHFLDDVFAGMNVRANKFRVAEAFEFNVGMRKYITKN
jgi:hypothetical protein